jgi:hypothetical protein
MDLSAASLEAFVRYHYFHEGFNSSVQVSLAGIITLRRIVDVRDGQHVLSSLIRSTGMPWPSNPRSANPIKVIDQVIVSLAQLSVVEALSAFDWFTIDLAANLAQFSSTLRKNGPFKHAHSAIVCDHKHPVEYCVCCRACAIQYGDNHKLAIRIQDLCSDLHLLDPAIEKLLPLFKYFRLVRNAVAHFNGIATSELVAHSQSSDLGNSLSYWDKVTRGAHPKLPELFSGLPIRVTMAHAILASAVCYRIAKALNRNSVSLVGPKGFVHMAAFYALFCSQHEFRSSQHDHPESAINYFLTKRYRVKAINNTEVIQIAKELGIWKDVKSRAKTIYPGIEF